MPCINPTLTFLQLHEDLQSINPILFHCPLTLPLLLLFFLLSLISMVNTFFVHMPSTPLPFYIELIWQTLKSDLPLHIIRTCAHEADVTEENI